MEAVAEFIGALVIALIIGALFYYGFKRRGPWAFWVFLLILFFTAWAGSFWIEPAGPLIWGFAWLPIFFWVFIVALVIAAAGETSATSRYERTTDVETTDREITESEAGAAAAFGIFFWVLLGILLAAIIIGLLT